MPNLTTLDLGECKLDKDVLFKILSQPENYPALQSLHFNKNKLQLHKWKDKDKKRFLWVSKFPQLRRIELADSKSEEKGYLELLTFLGNWETDIISEPVKHTVMPLEGLLLRKRKTTGDIYGQGNLSRVATNETEIRELLNAGGETLMLSGNFINTRTLDLILRNPPDALRNIFCVQVNITFSDVEDYRQRFNAMGIRLHSVNTLPEMGVGDIPSLPREPAPVYLVN